MRIGRKALLALAVGSAIAIGGYAAGSFAAVGSSDTRGRPVKIVVHPIPHVAKQPVTWDDSKPTFLPGTTVTVTVTRRSFLVIHDNGLSVIACDGGVSQVVAT